MAASISRLPTLGGKAAARGAAIMAERPLSDRRQALDRAIILKAAAQKAVETTAQPVRRCDAVIEEITRLRTGLASLYQRDQRLTGEWHRAHHALVDAGRGTCDASNATPDGGTRFGSEWQGNRRSGECLARRLGTPVPISARPPQFVESRRRTESGSTALSGSLR